jgi:hypothetical protein
MRGEKASWPTNEKKEGSHHATQSIRVIPLFSRLWIGGGDCLFVGTTIPSTGYKDHH